MTIPIVWCTYKEGIDARGPWDVGLLEHVFAGDYYDHGREFEHVSGFSHTSAEHAIVVFPARHHADAESIARLNHDLSWFQGVVLILTGDEDGIFPWREVQHPNIRFWVQCPKESLHADLVGHGQFFGFGFEKDTPRSLRSADAPEKPLRWVFAGQNTHERRIQAVNGLQRLRSRVHGRISLSDGFMRGMPRAEYLAQLLQAKVAPCPSGPATPDTFRVYESLEAGCLPILDDLSPRGEQGFWKFVYPDVPMPTIVDWDEVDKVMVAALKGWPRNANIASAWWQQHKRHLGIALNRDLGFIGAGFAPPPRLQIIIPTSPIPSHPSTEMLETTIASIRAYPELKDVEIIVACDGIRDEQYADGERYNEYIRQVCWKANHVWHRVTPFLAPQWLHQASLVRETMDALVDAETVMLVEHDTPFNEKPIDWAACIEMVAYGAVDVLRFHHEAQILDVHKHLMLDHETVEMMGVPLRRTVQFSARPHIARADYYRWALHRLFSPEARCFIEDRMYSFAQTKPRQHRLAIYHPEGPIVRTLHEDGRAGGPKFDKKQVW